MNMHCVYIMKDNVVHTIKKIAYSAARITADCLVSNPFSMLDIGRIHCECHKIRIELKVGWPV